MKKIKLYNIIFPIWLLWLFPPVIFIVFFGNLLVDSIVIYILFRVLKISALGYKFKPFYLKTIVKVWGFGIIGDVIGAAVLLGVSLSLDSMLNFGNGIIEGIASNPFSDFGAFIIIFACVSLSAGVIFLLNYFITFKKLLPDKLIRLKFALYISLITMPWTFFIPSNAIYSFY